MLGHRLLNIIGHNSNNLAGPRLLQRLTGQRMGVGKNLLLGGFLGSFSGALAGIRGAVTALGCVVSRVIILIVGLILFATYKAAQDKAHCQK